MSRMTMMVEFLPGTDIKDALEEAKQKAQMLDLSYVTFSFNGVSFSIGRNADIDKASVLYTERTNKYIVFA